MIVARWQFKARFGMKQKAIEKTKNWWGSIGAAIGQTDYAIMTGSVGAKEALVTVDVRVKDMAKLDAQWQKLTQRKDHKKFASELEPLIVSGSTRWEIFRVVE